MIILNLECGHTTQGDGMPDSFEKHMMSMDEESGQPIVTTAFCFECKTVRRILSRSQG